MNERIKDLAFKTGFISKKSNGDEWRWGYIDPELAEKLKQFAELIVRECMDLASAEQKRYANITHRDMNECAVALGNFSLLIKDHFEDEE